MSDLITPPSPPSTEPNVTSPISTSGGYSLGAGETLYSTSIFQLFDQSDYDPNATSFVLSNAGTMWNQNAERAQVLYLMNWGEIRNSGLIVAQSDGVAESLFVTSSFSGGLHNSGSIYALSSASTATAIAFWSGHTELHNSGTIAAQGAISATAILAANGAEIVNAAGGAILAEGRDAVAVYLGRGHFQVDGRPPSGVDIVNHGLIEAQSTSSSIASVAVYVAHLDGESMIIENDGVIRADVAIYSDSYAFSPPQHSADHIINHAGGLIDGQVDLGLGDDRIVNAGEMIGYVDLGAGDDLFDSQLGQHRGNAEMGWGDDIYLGGSGVDFATGNRGNDHLLGGAGNDLLLGGWGDDSLNGGAGNDGLYGEGGNDAIATSGGDWVDAGLGDDRVVLGDYTFAYVSGGAGHDVLVLPSDARILDLEQVVGSGRVSGIEEVLLAGGGRLVVHAGDVAALNGGTTLRISAAGAGTVDLAGSWTKSMGQTIAGTKYDVYVSGGVQLLVAAGLVVNLGSDPAAASGLDPVASGTAAPLPGRVAGAELTEYAVLSNRTELVSDLEIFAKERWSSTDGAPIIGSHSGTIASLINGGTMESNGTGEGAWAIVGYNYQDLHNYGTISVSALAGTANLLANKESFDTYGLKNTSSNLVGNAHGIALGGGASDFRNEGTVRAQTDQAIAVGYSTYGAPGENRGTIEAHSSHFIGVGVYAHNGGNFVNSGTIEATGSWGAYGFGSSTHKLNLVNSGTIYAHAAEAGREGVAIHLYYASGTQRITNSGAITGEVAIRSEMTVNGNSVWLENSGQITGRIEFGIGPAGSPARDDVIINSGTITGAVSLGAGRDVYDGTNGRQSGTVKGQDGNDLLIGTSGKDTLDGGNGQDVLFGKGGDTLTGGAGRDAFVFTGIVAGQQAEVITDFVSGTDRIDLRALGATSVTINGSTVTAVTGSGTLTIKVTGVVKMSDIITAGTGGGVGTSDDDVLVGGAGGASLSGGEGYDLLVGGAGNDVLDGGGAGTQGIGEIGDVMWGGAGDDTYVVDAANDQVVEGANGGVDTIQIVRGLYDVIYHMSSSVENLTGGSGYGNALDNLMTGSADSNLLAGGEGNDVLNGLGGWDQLFGDAGADRFVFGSVTDSVATNPDLLSAFEHGIDRIDVSKLVPTDLSLSHIATYPGAVTDVTLQTAGGALTIRVDGFVDHSDFMSAFQATGGTGGRDNLFGDDRSNWLQGLAGDDWVKGGAGSDTLDGGDGNDKLMGGDGQDALVGGRGADRFYVTSLSGSVDRIADFSSEDRIYLDAQIFTALQPGPLSDDAFRDGIPAVMPGTRIFYNSYSGEVYYDPDGDGEAAPVVILFVEPGTALTASSFVVYSGDPQTIESTTSYTLGTGESSLLLTGTAAVNGTGNEVGNSITGNDAANRLNGLDGNDQLVGAGGDDVLIGGVGGDQLDGGEGSDIYVIAEAGEHGLAEFADSGASGTDEVRFAATAPGTLKLLAGDSGVERVVVGTGTGVTAATSGTAALNVDARLLGNGVTVIGNSGANILQATAYADMLSGGVGIDRLYGYAGNDTLDGGRDADVMYGGAGDDTYVIDHSSDAAGEFAGEGTDTALSSVAYTLRANVENLVQAGLYSINGTGNKLANAMTGNAGSNRLYGLDGNDRLIGNEGNDTLDGGSGDDVLSGGLGSDIYRVDSIGDSILENFGEGLDRVEASVSYTLGANLENLTLLGGAAIDGVGNGLNNVLKGTAVANVLKGMAGNDKLYGGSGADVLEGGDGNDWLEGGAGRDEFTGGLGSDRFVFREGDLASASTAAADVVHDFSRAQGDKIRLDLLDANTTVSGRQAFDFIGSGQFSGIAGELRYEQSGGNTVIQADVNGDGTADFAIQLTGTSVLASGDFIL